MSEDDRPIKRQCTKGAIKDVKPLTYLKMYRQFL